MSPWGELRYFSLRRLGETLSGKLDRLPFFRRLLLENLGRAAADANDLSGASEAMSEVVNSGRGPFPFRPARLLLQDASGVPLLQDYIALREEIEKEAGAVPGLALPTTLVIDHSTDIAHCGSAAARRQNLLLEYQQHEDRYRFLRWCAENIPGLDVVPPGSGILHSLNLERFCTPLVVRDGWLVPDSAIGGDSHTTMANGAGTLCWGAGGTEILALMAGREAQIKIPSVVGLYLDGALRSPAGAADLAYALATFLRREAPAGAIIEAIGPGVQTLSVYDRATVANMAPEYGAWLCFFPVDAAVTPLLRRRGMGEDEIQFMLEHMMREGLTPRQHNEVQYDSVVRFDLSAVSRTVAGPSVPWTLLSRPAAPTDTSESYPLRAGGKGPRADAAQTSPLADGALVLAAIASCTTTSNPRLLVEAALLAQALQERGVKVPWHVKTSFSPGSPALIAALNELKLLGGLAKLGFTVDAYGCATCVGNSGALNPAVEEAIGRDGVKVAAVLSGNRNFPRRIHPLVEDSFLASPALVVAYAVAGTIHIDFAREPLTICADGQPVFLEAAWPQATVVDAHVERVLSIGAHEDENAQGANLWNELKPVSADQSLWRALHPRFAPPPFATPEFRQDAFTDLVGTRCLAVFGDEITTDHISPIGRIRSGSAAEQYIRGIAGNAIAAGTYLGWRGHPEVMRRGTFDNLSIVNLLVPGIAGPYSIHETTGTQREISVVADMYEQTDTPLVIIAGYRYGAGSARDWAAKGTRLLGVRCVLACSFERIHRANLVAAGVIPIRIPETAHPSKLKVSPKTSVQIIGLSGASWPQQEVRVLLSEGSGVTSFTAMMDLESSAEYSTLRHGGIIGSLIAQFSQPMHA